MNIGSTLLRLFSDRPSPETQRLEPRLSNAVDNQASKTEKAAEPLIALPPPAAPE